MPVRVDAKLIRLFAGLLIVLAVASSARAQDSVANPGFETGDFTSWVIDGTANTPIVDGTTPHAGAFSALVGNLSGTEPDGDSSFYQTVAVQATGNPHLTYWRNLATVDSITFDWQDVYVQDTGGVTLATVQHVCNNTGAWELVDFDMTPYSGTTVRIKFLVHQDGFGDDTSMRVDDVAVEPTTPVELTGFSVE